MTTTRKYHKFSRRYLLINILTMLPFVPVLVFIVWRASSNHWDIWAWIASAIFVVGAIFGLWFQHYRHTRFNCPECGRLIIHRARVGEYVNFYCETCDIRWETGLFMDSGE